MSRSGRFGLAKKKMYIELSYLGMGKQLVQLFYVSILWLVMGKQNGLLRHFCLIWFVFGYGTIKIMVSLVVSCLFLSCVLGW